MNSEMDLMILNKVKGIQGTVDNIGQKVDTTIQKVEEGNSNVSQKLDNLQVDVDLTTVNSTIGTDKFVPLDELIKDAVIGCKKTYTENDTVIIPKSIYKIKVTACGGGGGGTSSSASSNGYGGGGGGGGSLGNGGDAETGTLPGYGGGGYGSRNNSSAHMACKGGDGIVIIEWGMLVL